MQQNIADEASSKLHSLLKLNDEAASKILSLEVANNELLSTKVLELKVDVYVL